jgi:hypothetical protein
MMLLTASATPAGNLFQDFEAQSPLARDDRRVVKAVNVGQTPGAGEILSVVKSLTECFAVQDHLCAQPAAGGQLDQRSKFGHDDGDVHTQQFTVIGQAQGMVAGRGRNHSTKALLVVEQKQRVACPPLLEAAGALQIIELAIDVRAADFSQRNRLGTRRKINPIGDAMLGADDVGQRELHGCYPGRLTPGA